MDAVSIATIVGTGIAAIGLPLMFLQYRQSKKPIEIKLPKPVEEKENLKILFKVNQRLSLELQQTLSEYITKNNAAHKLMFENMTFEKYLHFAQNNHEHYLSERLYNEIDKMTLTRVNIDSLQKSLEEQNKNLLSSNNQLKTLV